MQNKSISRYGSDAQRHTHVEINGTCATKEWAKEPNDDLSKTIRSCCTSTRETLVRLHIMVGYKICTISTTPIWISSSLRFYKIRHLFLLFFLSLFLSSLFRFLFFTLFFLTLPCANQQLYEIAHTILLRTLLGIKCAKPKQSYMN